MLRWADSGQSGRTWVEAGLPGAREQEVGAGVDAQDGVHGGPVQVGQGRVDRPVVLRKRVPLDAKDVRLCPQVQQDAAAHRAIEGGRLQHRQTSEAKLLLSPMLCTRSDQNSLYIRLLAG